MLGIRIILKTRTNNLQIKIPDALKNRDLEIIVLPAKQDEYAHTDEYEFWSEQELRQMGKLNLGTPLSDKENYSKW